MLCCVCCLDLSLLEVCVRVVVWGFCGWGSFLFVLGMMIYQVLIVIEFCSLRFATTIKLFDVDLT